MQKEIQRNNNDTHNSNNTNCTTIFHDINNTIHALIVFYTFCAHNTTIEESLPTGKILDDITNAILALRKLRHNVDTFNTQNQHNNNRLPFSLVPISSNSQIKQFSQNNNTTRVARTVGNYTRPYSEYIQGSHNLQLLTAAATEYQKTITQSNPTETLSRTEQI